jgi:hypothetical protein
MQTANKTNLVRGNPQWVKGGASPNPTGRPRNEPLLSPEVRRQLNQICPEPDANGRTWLVYLGEKLLKLASKGNPAAIKEILERIDGKVTENVQLDIQLTAIKQMTNAELDEFIARAISDGAQS